MRASAPPPSRENGRVVPQDTRFRLRHSVVLWFAKHEYVYLRLYIASTAARLSLSEKSVRRSQPLHGRHDAGDTSPVDGRQWPGTA